MRVRRIMLLTFTIRWMIVHLGTKPRKGGSPARDSRLRSITKDACGKIWVVILNFLVDDFVMVDIGIMTARLIIV